MFYLLNFCSAYAAAMEDRFLDRVCSDEHHKLDLRIYSVRRSAALELGTPATQKRRRTRNTVSQVRQ
jgi:hypothetical protein